MIPPTHWNHSLLQCSSEIRNNTTNSTTINGAYFTKPSNELTFHLEIKNYLHLHLMSTKMANKR